MKLVEIKVKYEFTDRVPLSYACYGTFTALFFDIEILERNGIERQA